MSNILDIAQNMLVYLQEVGPVVRHARESRGLTQAELAAAADVARTTLNQLENGVFPDIGVRKLMAILGAVGLRLRVVSAPRRAGPDYLRMASVSASTSFREPLTGDELAHVLLTAKVPADRRPHLRAILEELPAPVLDGVVRQVAAWSTPGKVHKNLASIAASVGVPLRIQSWTTGA
jgi:transcriptional regulator with XRE-family HTH domain